MERKWMVPKWTNQSYGNKPCNFEIGRWRCAVGVEPTEFDRRLGPLPRGLPRLGLSFLTGTTESSADSAETLRKLVKAARHSL